MNVERPRSATLRGLLPVLLLCLGALLLRLARLHQQPLWYDEIAGLYRASADGLRALLARLANDVQAPLYDLLMAPVVHLFGTGLLVARIPALLASVALVPISMALSRRLGAAPGMAWLAGAWVAVDPYLVRYGVEGRPYALFACLSAALLLSALRVSEQAGRGAWLTGLLGAALALIHPYGVALVAAIWLWLALNGDALRAASARVVPWLLLPLLALLVWLPLALHQLATKSMNGIYAGLDGRQLLAAFDAWTLVAPRTLGPGRLEWAVQAGRGLTLLLVCLGLWSRGSWWRRGARGVGVPIRVGSLLLFGAGGFGVLLWWQLPVERLAHLASSLAKQGRALDDSNLEFITSLHALLLLAALGLAALGLLLALAPKWTGRWRGRASPLLAPVFMLGVPLLAIFLLDASGRSTFAPRNAIFAVPLAAALIARGLSRLPRPVTLVLMAVLAAQAWWGLGALSDFHKRRPWPDVAIALQADEAEPLAFPPWLARCVEYYTGRPWESVFGSRDPATVSDWARRRGRVVLVSGYENLDPGGEVRAALLAGKRSTRVLRLRGLNVEWFDPR